jgi:hypothetical protein
MCVIIYVIRYIKYIKWYIKYRSKDICPVLYKNGVIKAIVSVVSVVVCYWLCWVIEK